MRLSILSLFLLVSCFSHGQYKDWHENHKLSWNDFKSHKLLSSKESSEYIVKAQIFTSFITSITIEDNLLSVEVLNRMFCKKSWVHPNGKSRIRLLHEQGHFDLREYYARLLRKAIGEYDFTLDSISQEFNTIIGDIEDGLDRHQQCYDDKTNYGSNVEMQYVYTNKIDSLLKGTIEYRKLRVVNEIE